MVRPSDLASARGDAGRPAATGLGWAGLGERQKTKDKSEEVDAEEEKPKGRSPPVIQEPPRAARLPPASNPLKANGGAS